MIISFESNWIAIIIATVISIGLGFTWFGPLFGKSWMRLMGINQKQIEAAKKKGMPKSTMPIMAVTTIISAYVMGIIVTTFGATSLSDGALIGFIAWLGFIATYSAGSVLWEGRSWSLWTLNNGYWLISYVLIGIILAIW